jgi:hypothetical protein
MSPPVPRQLARRLLTYEAAAGKDSEPTASAVSRVCEKLRQPLSTLAGVAGFHSLLYCALRLARAEVPTLRAVTLAEDGSLQGLDALGPQKDQDRASEGGAILIAHLLGLLITFIGIGITSRLVQDVWPEVTFANLDSGKEKKA